FRVGHLQIIRVADGLLPPSACASSCSVIPEGVRYGARALGWTMWMKRVILMERKGVRLGCVFVGKAVLVARERSPGSRGLTMPLAWESEGESTLSWAEREKQR
ncbi:unnamed protein product, partial [Scytosiphon promiscuus]